MSYVTTDEIKYCEFPRCEKMAFYVRLAPSNHPMGTARPRVWTCEFHKPDGKNLLEKILKETSDE